VPLDPLRRKQVAALVREHGYEYRETPFQLTSGGLSHDYVDGKHAIATGGALRLASEAVLEMIDEPFDAVGGPTMGADALAHGVSLLSGAGWFSVRKEAKGHGLHSWVEGTRIGEGDRVLMVEDVSSTGASLLRAIDQILELGVTVVAATGLLDRGPGVARLFASRSIRWVPLVTWEDIGIEPLGAPDSD
jgi:orotate phosphoribosyltransferase